MELWFLCRILRLRLRTCALSCPHARNWTRQNHKEDTLSELCPVRQTRSGVHSTKEIHNLIALISRQTECGGTVLHKMRETGLILLKTYANYGLLLIGTNAVTKDSAAEFKESAQD